MTKREAFKYRVLKPIHTATKIVYMDMARIFVKHKV